MSRGYSSRSARLRSVVLRAAHVGSHRRPAKPSVTSTSGPLWIASSDAMSAGITVRTPGASERKASWFAAAAAASQATPTAPIRICVAGRARRHAWLASEPSHPDRQPVPKTPRKSDRRHCVMVPQSYRFGTNSAESSFFAHFPQNSLIAHSSDAKIQGQKELRPENWPSLGVAPKRHSGRCSQPPVPVSDSAFGRIRHHASLQPASAAATVFDSRGGNRYFRPHRGVCVTGRL